MDAEQSWKHLAGRADINTSKVRLPVLQPEIQSLCSVAQCSRALSLHIFFLLYCYDEIKGTQDFKMCPSDTASIHDSLSLYLTHICKA